MTLPLPARFGGGKPVATSTREVATRLGLVPEELGDVAEARGGTLPPAVVKKLDDAYAEGQTLGEHLGLEGPKDGMLGNRFANQLLRIDREMQRSPPSTQLSDSVEAVTRDTLADIQKNLGQEAADASKPGLAALQPL
jgi:hypothetical protein